VSKSNNNFRAKSFFIDGRQPEAQEFLRLKNLHLSAQCKLVRPYRYCVRRCPRWLITKIMNKPGNKDTKKIIPGIN